MRIVATTRRYLNDMPAVLTLQETIDTLKRSNIPTILVEGPGDLHIYSQIERIMGPTNISVFPCNGKENVLAIQNKLRDQKYIHTLAVVDSDFWTLYGAPIEISGKGIRTTVGYSIENDAIHFGGILKIMTPSERARFDEELLKYAAWFAIHMQCEPRDANATYRKPVRQVLDDPVYYSKSITKYTDHDVCMDLIAEIELSPIFHLRGKNLMQIVTRQLGRAGRSGSHSGVTLLQSASVNMEQYLQDIIDWILKLIPESKDPSSA